MELVYLVSAGGTGVSHICQAYWLADQMARIPPWNLIGVSDEGKATSDPSIVFCSWTFHRHEPSTPGSESETSNCRACASQATRFATACLGLCLCQCGACHLWGEQASLVMPWKERSKESPEGGQGERMSRLLVSASALSVGQGRIHDAAP